MDPPTVDICAGSGPRHLALDPSQTHAYVIHESDRTITVHDVGSDGTLGDSRQHVDTLPDGAHTSGSTAETLVHPSGRFIYGTVNVRGTIPGSFRGSAPSFRRRTFASLAMRTTNEVTCSAITASSPHIPPCVPKSSSAQSGCPSRCGPVRAAQSGRPSQGGPVRVARPEARFLLHVRDETVRAPLPRS